MRRLLWPRWPATYTTSIPAAIRRRPLLLGGRDSLRGCGGRERRVEQHRQRDLGVAVFRVAGLAQEQPEVEVGVGVLAVGGDRIAVELERVRGGAVGRAQN